MNYKISKSKILLVVLAVLLISTALIAVEQPLSTWNPFPNNGTNVNPDSLTELKAYFDLSESGLNSQVSSWTGAVQPQGYLGEASSGSASPGNSVSLTAIWYQSSLGNNVKVCWDGVSGWNTPPNICVDATPGDTYHETGTYSPASFSVAITQSVSSPASGQSVCFSISSNSGTSPFSYQWYLNGAAVSGATGSTWTTSSLPSGSDSVYLVVDDISTQSTSNTLSFTVGPQLAISASSSHNPSDIGQSITFDTSASGGYGSYTYSYVLYDGTSSSDSQLTSGSTSSFSYTFDSTGSYLLDYSVTDGAGSSASTSLTESVNSDPTVTISSSQNPTDIGNSVTFTASASGGSGSYTYQWYSSGSAISGATSSTYSPGSYSASGTYSYYVDVTDAAGYTVSSNTIDETVNSDPTVSASASVSSADVGYSITFDASPSGGTGPYSYSWTIGGSQVSTSQDFSYSFSSAGSYTVEVTVTDSIGETYSASVTVSINNNPSVSVSSSQNPTDVGNGVTFTASESGGTGTISYSWTVNGASEGAGSSLSYSFSSAGSYTVEVTVTDSDGHTSSSSLTETVNSDPTVTISSSQNPTDVGNTVTFTASASGGSGSYTYQWYLNSAAVSGATSSSYSTSFSSSGTDSVYVIIKDSIGNSVTSSTLDETVNADPSVTISSSQNPTDVGNSVTFTASSSGGTGSYSYQWYLNSNAVSGATSSTYSVSFSSAGSDTVYVVISDSVGNAATSSTLDETVNADPSVTISSSQNPTDVGNSVTFTASASGGTGSYSYQWYLNSAAVSGATSSSYSTSFGSSGSDSIYVIIHDGVGDSAQSSTLTETVNSDPSVSISSSQNPTDVGNSVTFTASASGGTGSYSYQWYLNSAAVSGATSSSYSTSFSSSGTDSVYVVIQDSIGNAATSSTITETVNSDPTVTISSSQNPTDVGNTVTFTASASGGSGSYTYQWYLNSAAVSGATSSSYSTSFSSSGTDSVYVVIQDSIGNAATSSTITETVNADPSVTITSSQNPTDIGNSVTFTASASKGTGSFSYIWYLNGATQSSTSGSFDYSFSSPGTYFVNVTIKDSLGDSSSYSFKETVNSDPAVTISTSHNPTDVSVAVTFSAEASGGTSPYNYTWEISGAVVSYLSSFSYSFTASGSFAVQLTIRDKAGNSASATITETVNADPSVSISSEYTTIDQGVNDSFQAEILGGTYPYTYSWTSNGIAVNSSSSFHMSFSSTGTYTISVSISDSLGETASDSITVTVITKPSISINGPDATDVNTLTTFTGNASYGTEPYNFYWYVNGVNVTSSSSGLYLSYTFDSPGTFNVSIKALDSQGASATSYLLVVVSSDPKVTISAKNTTIDLGESDTFFSQITSGSGPYQYAWYIGGSEVSSLSSFAYVFASEGTIEVNLLVTDSVDNQASSMLNVTVNVLPDVTFSSKYSTLDQGMQDLFTGDVSGGTGPYNYTWTVNNVIIGYSPSESYVFTSPGTYSIELEIRDSDGNIAAATHTVIVHALPIATISASRIQLDSGQTASFSGGITGGTPLFAYSWTINGGTSIDNASSFSWVFSNPGNYTVEVTITDKFGYTSVDRVNITVYSDPSVSISSAYPQIDQEATESFTSSITGGYGPFTYEWLLNGNLISSSPSFSYVFNSIGVRTIELTVSDGNGFFVSENVSVNVVSQPSVSFASEYERVDSGIQDQFNASLQFGTGPYNYSWSVNSESVGYGKDLSYSFSSPGTFYVNLTVRDYFGFISSSSQRIVVVGPPVPTIFANRTSIDQGMSISFLSGISGGVGPYTYSWELNGQVLSHNQSLVYSFSSPGAYTISLFVQDSFGDSGSYSIGIQVNNQLTVAITSNSSKMDSGQTGSFKSLVSGGTGPYDYSWYVDGTLVSSSQTFSYPFDSPGTFTIKLTVIDSLGESSSYSYSITVYQSLSASLNVSHPTIDENITESISITAKNGTAPYSYAITINGILVSNHSSYSAYFTTPGIYQIKAFINDSSGESIILETSIVVRSNPTVTIVTPENRTDANVPITFRAILNGGTGPYNYSWLIGGQVYTNATLSYAFFSPGKYEIQLTVSDSFGREAISAVNETVYSDPAAKLVHPSDIIASIEESLSLNITGGIPSYSAQWYFPGGEQFSGQNITYAFSTSGPNTFEVKISDSSGYVDSQNFTVDVHLFVAIAANQTSGLGPLEVQFSSSILGGSGYSFNWSFGNGHYSLSQNPVYCFPTGNYSVHFSVVSANGASGGASTDIESLPAPVTFRYSSNLNITQSFHFRAIPNWDAAGPYNMSWSFPNGQAIAGLNISYKFPVYNELNTVIAAFSYDGKTWTQYLTVRMIPSTPIISFHPPTIIPVDTMLALNATASAPDSSSFSYSWDVNGSLNSGQSILYYFSHSGSYNVSVTVTDSLGASSTALQTIEVLPLATNSSISISYTKETNGPMTYYTIEVQSLSGITAVEAFLGSASLTIYEINSSYSHSGEISYWNLTLNQGNYQAAIYPIQVVAFNNASSSNSITISFVVSPEFSSSSGFSFGSIIALFGGISNFLITILTLGGLVIAWETLRRQDNPDVTIVEGSGAKAKRIRLQGKKETR